MGLFDKFIDLLNSCERPKTESQIEAAKDYLAQVEWEEHTRANCSLRLHASKRNLPLRWLPLVFYVIAVLGYIGWIINSINLKSWEVFGIGIGSTITCLAFGRVIELLQIIADELQQKRMSE